MKDVAGMEAVETHHGGRPKASRGHQCWLCELTWDERPLQRVIGRPEIALANAPSPCTLLCISHGEEACRRV